MSLEQILKGNILWLRYSLKKSKFDIVKYTSYFHGKYFINVVLLSMYGCTHNDDFALWFCNMFYYLHIHGT